MFSGSITKTVTNVLAISLLLNAFIVVAEYLAVARVGTGLLLHVAVFATLPLLASILVLPVAIGLLFWKKYRTIAVKVVCSGLICFVVGFGGLRLGRNIRHQGFANVAQRSQSVVSAIHRFEARFGRPPDNLEQLVPEFLTNVPDTGIAAYPKYEYLTPADALYEGNRWILKVNAISGSGWDVFLYFPLQNYPSAGYGGTIERIEDWAYVHE